MEEEQYNYDYIFNNTKCPDYMRQIIEKEKKVEDSIAKKKPKTANKRTVTHRIHYELKVKNVTVELESKFWQF